MKPVRKKKAFDDELKPARQRSSEKRRFSLDKRVIFGTAAAAVTLGIGLFFTTREIYEISPDFYSKVPTVSLSDSPDLSKGDMKKEEKMKLSGGGQTGGGGDPTAAVTRKGVLGILEGEVRGSMTAQQSLPVGSGSQTVSGRSSSTSSQVFGKGGYASGIDQVLAGTGGLAKGGGGTGRKGEAGIGIGTGTGSGFGGGSGGTDDLLGSLMSGGGSSVSVKKTKSIKVNQSLPSASPYSGESYKDVVVSEFTTVAAEPLSTFSIDVDAASYANFRRYINEGTLPPKEAVRIEEFVNYFDYAYTKPAGTAPFSINTELTECPWNRKHYLAHIGLQGKVIEEKKRAVSNLVFLIDVSGSMMDENKLPLVKKAFRLLVEQMRPEDRVSIVVYAGSAGCVLTPTGGKNKQKILAALENLQAGGSTAGGEGIVQAYSLAKRSFIPRGNNRVVLATDGDFNVGVSSDEELVSLIETKRNEGIFLTVLGFGTGNYQDSKMEQLADKGNGNYAYIDNLLEAKKVLVNQMQGTLYTIAKDVKLQVEFNPKTTAGYRLIGYDNRRLAKEDFNNDAKDAGELGAGHTVTALYEIIPAGQKVPASVDELKYQKTTAVGSNSTDLFTVKLRYKNPKEDRSMLLSKAVVKGSLKPFASSSTNQRFSAAIAGSMMILKGYTGVNMNLEQCIALGKSSKGTDYDGYRSEFITLLEKTKLLLDQQAYAQR